MTHLVPKVESDDQVTPIELEITKSNGSLRKVLPADSAPNAEEKHFAQVASLLSMFINFPLVSV